MYVLQGPQTIGNIFGHYGHLVPEGKFAVVSDGEYSNGGYGPSQAIKGLFASSEEAQQAIADSERAEAAQAAEARKQFAREQHGRLVAMGFGPRAAACIMRVAGPGRAVAAVEWADKALERVGTTDALDCILRGRGGTNRFGKDRMIAVLQTLGIEPPDVDSARGLEAILSGAQVALLIGLPAREAVA